MSTEATGEGRLISAGPAGTTGTTEANGAAGAGESGEPTGSPGSSGSAGVDEAAERDGPDEAGGADEDDEAERSGGDDDFPDDEVAESGEGEPLDDEGPEYEEDYEDHEPDEVAEPRRARRWPRVLLALGFVVLAAAIVGGAIAIVGSVTHGFKKPVKITYKKSAVFSLKTGDCLDPRGQSYSLVSCDSPHVAEVFATFTLAGAKWPGTTAVAAAASDGCTSRLTGYLNPQLAISLASAYVYPDSVAWQAGTRTVICEVRAPSGQLTGSVRGASASAG